jgi:preprotein translocase subunit SecF
MTVDTGTHICVLTYSIIDDIVVRSDLLFSRILQVLHSRAHLSEIDVAEAAIEQNLTRVQTKLKTELLIVN